jgi:predicted DsbA family dithiol-disulfide isomerase
MTAGPGLEEGNTMKVEVYRDFACAWCRLGTRRFEAAVRSAGAEPVELVHRPYQLDPEAPEGESQPLLQVLAAMFGADRAATMFDNVVKLGAAEGVEYHVDRAIATSTLAAHRLMWFAERHAGAAVRERLADAVYDAYFRDGLDIGVDETLAALAEDAGLDGAAVRAFLASREGAAEVREQGAKARAEGITTVPTYVFPGGEVLTGAVSTDELVAALVRARS